MNQMRAADIIRHLDMKPHPEGGHYVETFRDDASTAIYFLLEEGEYSHWHRVHGSAELWHHYAGDALQLMLSSDGSEIAKHHLGLRFEKNEKPMVVVPAGCWQMARSLGHWTLVGCTVAPGFDFANFEMAPPDWEPGPS